MLDDLGDFIFGPWGLGLFLAALVGLFLWASHEDALEHARLTRACLADGRKEYECYAMIHNNSTQTTTIMPLPVGR